MKYLNSIVQFVEYNVLLNVITHFNTKLLCIRNVLISLKDQLKKKIFSFLYFIINKGLKYIYEKKIKCVGSFT